MVTRTVRTLAGVCALASTAACGAATEPAAASIVAEPARIVVTGPSTTVASATADGWEAHAESDHTVRSKLDTILTNDIALVSDAVARNRANRIDPPEPAVESEPLIDQVWIDLAECESNQRWEYNGSSGYDGGLQFLPSTWTAVGGDDFATFAWQATPVEQVTVAERLLEVQGWGAWPACSRKLGLR